MTFLNNKPDPETEFAEEIKAAEAELAEKPEPVSEPEAEAPEAETPADTVEQTKGDADTLEIATLETSSTPKETLDKAFEQKVPISALHQARREKQELERQYNEMMAREQQWQAWAAQQQGQQTEEKPIDPQQDPLGAMEQMRTRMERQATEMAEFRQQQAQQQEVAAVTQAYRSSAQEFSQENKDFQDAYKYALNSRGKELEALGYQPQVIQQQLIQEEQQLAWTALRNRQNPAKVIYDFAKARGYAGPKPAEPAKPAPSKAVELMAEKAAVSTSLSTGGQSPRASGDISDTELVNLKGAAFDAAFEKRFMPKRGGLFAR